MKVKELIKKLNQFKGDITVDIYLDPCMSPDEWEFELDKHTNILTITRGNRGT